jgi:hypothetical protein
MANFITLPTATPTGLGQLGQVLMGGAAEYAAEKRRTDEEARLRANQLADIQSARDYQDRRYATERRDRRDEVNAERLYAGKAELMRLGYLDPKDFDNPQAVSAALAKVHADGTAAKYKAAIEAGDLSYADLASGDEAKITAGLQKYSERAAKETTRREGATAGGTAQAADVQRRQRALDQQNNALTQQIASFESESAKRPSQQEIEIRAAEIASPTAKSPGNPTAAEIAAQRPMAEQSLRQEGQEALFARVQAAKEQIALNRQQQMALTAQSEPLTRQGFFAPASVFADPTSEPAAAAPAPTTPPVSLDQARAILQQKYGAPATPAPNPALAPLPGDDPIIAEENARRKQQGIQSQFIDPVNQALARVDSAKQHVAALRTVPVPTPNMAMGGQGMNFPAAAIVRSPQDRAQALSVALTELQTAQQQLQDAQRRRLSVQDPTVAAAQPGMPTASNANGTTPFPFSSSPQWWQQQPPAAAGF